MSDPSVRPYLNNLLKIYWIRGSWMAIILLPVIIPFFKARGLNMQEIFWVQTFFSFIIVVLEVPSGYIADVLGRKQAIVWGAVGHALGFAFLAQSQNFWLFLLGEFFLAFGNSLISGADVAMIYDSLEASEQAHVQEVPQLKTSFLGKRLFYSSMGETLAGLLGGLTVLVSLNFTAQLNFLISCIPLVIALTLVEPPRKKMQTQTHRENFKWILKTVFRSSILTRRILFFLIIYNLSTLMAAWTFQDYWMFLGVPLSWFGVFWAASNFNVAMAARFAHRIELKLGATQVLLMVALLPALGFLGMSWISSMTGAFLFILFQTARGVNQVLTVDALNRRVPAEMRATVNSFVGLGVRIGFVMTGPLMGYLIQHQGSQMAYRIFGGLYVVAFFVIALPLIYLRQEFQVQKIIRSESRRTPAS